MSARKRVAKPTSKRDDAAERRGLIAKAVVAAIAAVEGIGAPENMSKAEYREFLGQLIADLGVCLEAVEGEIRAEDER